MAITIVIVFIYDDFQKCKKKYQPQYFDGLHSIFSTIIFECLFVYVFFFQEVLSKLENGRIRDNPVSLRSKGGCSRRLQQSKLCPCSGLN